MWIKDTRVIVLILPALMKRTLFLTYLCTGASLFLPACDKSAKSGGASADSVGADGVRIVKLTGNDTLQYNLKEITAAPGEKLNIELTNIGTMPKQAMAHNWVLLKPMSDADLSAICMAASTKPPEYLPDDVSKIVAHTKMVGSKETDTIQITVPAEPGSYPYVCTFPGHFTLMRGNLVVKAK